MTYCSNKPDEQVVSSKRTTSQIKTWSRLIDQSHFLAQYDVFASSGLFSWCGRLRHLYQKRKNISKNVLLTTHP